MWESHFTNAGRRGVWQVSIATAFVSYTSTIIIDFCKRRQDTVLPFNWWLVSILWHTVVADRWYTVMFSKLYSSTCHLLDRLNWFCSAFIVSSDCQFLTLQFLNANSALFLSFLIASVSPILMSTCTKCLT